MGKGYHFILFFSGKVIYVVVFLLNLRRGHIFQINGYQGNSSAIFIFDSLLNDGKF